MTINMTMTAINELYTQHQDTSIYQDIRDFVKHDTTYEIFCFLLMFTTAMTVYDYFKNFGKTEIYERRLMHARTAYELKRNELCTLKESVLKVLKTYYKQNTPDENVEILLKDLGVEETYFTEPDIVFQTNTVEDKQEDKQEDKHETPKHFRRNPKRRCAPTSFVCENSFDVLEDDEKDEEKDE
jgi:hypothetical protein